MPILNSATHAFHL